MPRASRSVRRAPETKDRVRRALVYERDSLVAERVRRMLTAERMGAAHVDTLDLFERLRAALPFDLYVIGVASPDALPAVPDLEALDPVLMLAPMDAQQPVNPYRVAHPRATLVDRELRDPNAIRSALAPGMPTAPEERSPGSALSAQSVRHAFEGFGLSERQLEVLGHALRGHTSSEIASRLFISELTVRNHLHAIYERVGVSGRRELLGRFVQGLLEGHA